MGPSFLVIKQARWADPPLVEQQLSPRWGMPNPTRTGDDGPIPSAKGKWAEQLPAAPSSDASGTDSRSHRTGPKHHNSRGDRYQQRGDVPTKPFQNPQNLGDIHRSAARDTLNALLVECFMRPDNISTAGIPLSNRAELMRDLLNYGFSNPTEVISFETLSKTLLKSPSSITKASREQFGVSPMQLLKQIRLQQVQKLLMDPEQQEQLGTQSIGSIAQRFGFTAPNHFARDFRTMFGEIPSQTYIRRQA